MSTLSWIVDSSFSTRLTVALLHFLWQGCAGGVLVIVSGWLLRTATSRTRYALNVTAMLLMAACLPVTFVLLGSPHVIADRPGPTGLIQELRAHPLVSEESPGTGIKQARAVGVEMAGSGRPSVEPDPAVETGSESTAVSSNVVFSTAWFPSFTSVLATGTFPTLSRWIATLYLIGVVLILGRLLGGVWGGHRLRKLASVVEDPALLEMVRNQARRLGLTVAPVVAWCERISIPVVVGIVAPMILLPASVVSGLTAGQLEALLLHELSHIRRFDPVVNLFQRMIEAMLFFHPAVWIVSRRISIERELAADDMVLAAGCDRPLYADALVRAAELASSISGANATRRAMALGASGTNSSEFKLRVLRLLGDSPPPKLNLSRTGILLTFLIVVMGGIFARSQSDKQQKPANATKANEVKTIDNGTSPFVEQKAVAKELEPFQGIWPMDICDSINTTLHAPQKEVNSWRWEINGNEIRWSRSGSEVWHLTFKVDPKKSPMEIDLTYLDGPFKGQTCLGMYKWGGLNKNMLQMSLQDPGANVPRPQSISMSSTAQTSMIFLNPRQSPIAQAKPVPGVDPVPVPVKTPVAKEMEPLLGTWAVDSCESEAAWLKVSERDAKRWRWTVKRNEILWGREGQEWRLNFRMDPKQTPKRVDLTFLDGPHKGETCLGIYERSGDAGKNLRIRMQDPGAKAARPTDFMWQAGSQTSRFTLQSIPAIDPAKELASFQGTWCWDFSQPWTWPQPIGVGTDSDGRKSEKRWVIEGNQITWVGRDGQRIYVNFAIDPFKAPKQIEWTFLNGPHSGKKSIGIYEPQNGNENNLWLCMTDPGSDAPRPTDISAGSLQQKSMISIYKVAAPAKPSAANALKRLQGIWQMELCDSTNRTLHAGQKEVLKWQWTIKDDEILWIRQGDVWKLKLNIHAQKSPREMDLTYLVAPFEMDLTYLSGPFKGAKCQGIMGWGGVDQQSLMIAVQYPGSDAPRPTRFRMNGEVKTGLMILRPSKPSAAERENAALQGLWTLRNFDTGKFDRNKDPNSWPLPGGKEPDQSGEGSELRWKINGNEIVWNSPSGQEIKASFTIEPDRIPKQIDLTFLSGPHKGEICPGIYQRDDLDDKILWLCVADPGSKKVRPKEFAYRWGEGHSVLSLYPFVPPGKP